MRVVALARPDRVSGVAVAVARMSSVMPANVAWTPLVVGPDLGTDRGPSVKERSPWSGARDVHVASWRSGASAVEQVLVVLRALRELKCDVVVPNDCEHGFVAAAIDHQRGLRCAMWLHADHLDGDALVERCGELADSFRAVSAAGRRRAIALADRLEIAIPRAGEPLPTVVEVPSEATSIPQVRDRLAVLYAGRLEKQVKRVLDLVKIADSLAATGTPFEMRIVGDGPARAELTGAMGEHVAAGRVRFEGVVPLEAMANMYAWADVTVLVSGSEGMPTVVLESLAQGRPVLVSDRCGGATELVAKEAGRIGKVFATGSATQAADILREWAGNRGVLQELGANAFSAAVRRFSPGVRAPEFAAFVAEAQRAAPKWNSALPLDGAKWWAKMLRAMEAIGPCSSEDLRRLATAWLEASGLIGKGIWSPGGVHFPLVLPNRPTPQARLFRAAMDRLTSKGARRIAVYGAGAHTRKLIGVIRSVEQVVAVVDDRAGHLNGPPADLDGLPVIAPSAIAAHGIDGVVISSDEHERELMVRAREWAGGLPVEPVYEALSLPSSASFESR